MIRTFSSSKSFVPWNDRQEDLEDHRIDHLSSARSTTQQQQRKLDSSGWQERSVDNRRVDSILRTDHPIRSEPMFRVCFVRPDRSMSSVEQKRRPRRATKEHYLRKRKMQRWKREREVIETIFVRIVLLNKSIVLSENTRESITGRKNLSWNPRENKINHRGQERELTESFVIVFAFRCQAKENRSEFLQFFV